MEPLCEPCTREGQNVDSRFYCTTCKEVYCNACSKKHKMYKMSIHHVIEPMNATDLVPNYQPYEKMCISKSTLSQSGRGDMSKDVSWIPLDYIDMSHNSRSNNGIHVTRHETKAKSDDTKDMASPDQHSTESENCSPFSQTTQLLLNKSAPNDQNTKTYTTTTLNLQAKTKANACESVSWSAKGTTYIHPTHSKIDVSEFYSYAYAGRVIGGSLKDRITDTEDEKNDLHVYEEIKEDPVDPSTENTDIYVVKLKESPLPTKELSGYFRLRLTTSGVEFLQESLNYFWPYPTIRRYGIDFGGKKFFLEFGRNCGRWCGRFEFKSKSYRQIMVKIHLTLHSKKSFDVDKYLNAPTKS